MNLKITAFVGVNENTDLAVSDCDRLLLVTKAGNAQTITVIGHMSNYTFNGMEMALERLRTFVPESDPKSKSAILKEVAEETGMEIIDLPLTPI